MKLLRWLRRHRRSVLGTATLVITADTGPLEQKLTEAENRVRASIRDMQAALDSLHLP